MINFHKKLSTRHLPEAFYTPRLIDTRPMGAAGTHEYSIQFAAVPDALTDSYAVRRYEKSISVHENGRPVVSIMATGLRKAEAQEAAMENLAACHREILRRHADYADGGRFPVRFRNAQPHESGFCWLTIRRDAHAMANPPYGFMAHNNASA